jgi:peroxiredoxin
VSDGDEERRATGDRPSLSRLDPDQAAKGATPATELDGPRPHPAPRAPVIDTRRYRWIIGVIGVALVLAFSIVQLAGHGPGQTGVAAGHRLRFFAAPLATSTLIGDANAHPTCSAARHDPRALNVCLLARHGPLVLAFFVTGARQCVRQVSALQRLAERFGAVQFAAVAINASRRSAADAVRAHGWTIPVAYDPDGRVGALYQVAACPMVELAGRGGIVQDRLIGDRWQSAAALAPRIRALARTAGPAG